MSLPIFLPFTSRVVRGSLGATEALLSIYELYSRNSARNIIFQKTPHIRLEPYMQGQLLYEVSARVPARHKYHTLLLMFRQ